MSLAEVQLPDYRAGIKEGKVRAYVQNRLLSLAGFTPQKKFRVEQIGPKHWEMTLDPEGSHRTGGRKRTDGVVPIVDVRGLDFEVGEKFAVRLDSDKVIIAEPFSVELPTTAGDTLNIDGVRLTDEEGQEQGSYYFTEVCSGGGGLSLAAILAGAKPSLAFEIDPDAAMVYHENIGNHVVIGDCREFTPTQIRRMVERETPSGRVRIGIAGVPCQPFSVARAGQGATGAEDQRNLFPWYLQVVDELGFDVIAIENVPGLIHEHKAYFREHVLHPLQDRGYHVTLTKKGLAPVLNAVHYGGYSDRERAWILCSKYGEIAVPEPTHGPGLNPYVAMKNSLADLLKEEEPDTEPLPPSVLALCERPEEKFGGDVFRLGVDCYISCNNFNKLGPQFRLMSRPAPTQLASQGYRDRIRWKGNLYRVREKIAARLNGFPDWFRGTMSVIGNAVPPLTMGLAVMQAIMKHLRMVDAMKLEPTRPMVQAAFF